LGDSKLNRNRRLAKYNPSTLFVFCSKNVVLWKSQEQPSLVVLPFTNLSGDAAQDYLADIITEGLTIYLSRIRDAFVIPRSTASTYKGKPINIRQIGRELGVRYVLEGSEQHSGNRVRASAQLIDVDTGAHLWADRFDAGWADLLQVQDDIITRLAREPRGGGRRLRCLRARTGDRPRQCSGVEHLGGEVRDARDRDAEHRS
jgi:TolB-like protein